MARSRPSARDALIKLKRQREELDAQEATLRESAAAELGKVLLDWGAETLEPNELRQIVQRTMTLGFEETLKRLTPK